jgi:hypothetical protein
MLEEGPTSRGVAELMPGLRADLERLVAIPSISSPGYPEPREHILEAFELVSSLFRDAGVEVGALELPDTAPIVRHPAVALITGFGPLDTCERVIRRTGAVGRATAGR